jgi:hypothetical protein
MVKLDLGAGFKKHVGFISVDKEPCTKPDVLWDLERFPWPWKDNSVEEVRMVHVLEHIGKELSVYKAIIRELYRICTDKAIIGIRVPYYRHRGFWADPTHVRVVTPLGIDHLSKKKNREWIADGYSNTPLALFWDIDFETESIWSQVDSDVWNALFPHMKLSDSAMQEFLAYDGRRINDLISEIHIVLRAVKTNV